MTTENTQNGGVPDVDLNSLVGKMAAHKKALIEQLEAHRAKVKITCWESCWCWDVAVLIIRLEEMIDDFSNVELSCANRKGENDATIP